MKRFAYYNENDPYAAGWLRGLIRDGLITDGEVDERSIADVSPDDVRGFARVHWFAGIGGWELALSLAGYDRWDVVTWTGSCPCQPFSCAGSQQGTKDERHLWPEFARLIRVCRPPVVFGEQVEGAVRLGWLDGVFADLEAADYACGASVLGAHSVGAPHIRQRLYWVADAGPSSSWYSIRPDSEDQAKRVEAAAESGGRSKVDRLADANGWNASTERQQCGGEQRLQPSGDGLGRLADLPGRGQRIDGSAPRDAGHADECGEACWVPCRIVHCRDGKARRISAEPSDEPLAHGLPRGVGPGEPRTCGLDDLATARASLKRAKRNRVGRLKAYGNAIAPELAAEFIAAYLESRP